MSDAVTEPQFDVISDGGLDAYAELNNRVEVAPFSLNFGSESRLASDFTREDFFRRLKAGTPHPTTSQPTPQAYVTLLEKAVRPVLAVTISSGLSGSLNAAEQARTLVPGTQTTLHDSRTLSAAQAFQVHAAMTARQRGHTVGVALDWMQRVSEQTELYFTIETLEYLKRGGRIGRVQATLGGLLNLKPVVTVDKKTGAYTNVGRARAWKGALEAVANQVTSRYGEGTPCGWACCTAKPATVPKPCWSICAGGIPSCGRALRRSIRCWRCIPGRRRWGWRPHRARGPGKAEKREGPLAAPATYPPDGLA
ncbi:DegV family protein [Deinococcus sp. KNUC1210]|uniref:DegV family protein n=1 Tax=Deinococcus sp. KNUC1210 TaxID=2917691 RepID=UPI00351D1C38